MIGNTRIVTPGDIAQSIFDWDVNDELAPNRRCVLSSWDSAVTELAICVDILDPSNADDISALQITVTWRVGLQNNRCNNFAQCSIQIDPQRGTRICVPSASFNVQVSYPKDPSLLPDLRQPRVSVAVHIGRGCGDNPGITGVARKTVIVSDSTTVFSTFPIVLAPGAFSGFFAIPDFAVSAVVATTEPNASILLIQRTSELGPIVSNTLLGPRDSDSVPVANGAQVFQVQNTGTTDQQVRVIFYLGV